MRIFLNEKFIALLIIINAILTVYLCYDNPPFQDIVVSFDHLVTILFVIEITYKIIVNKKVFFRSGWNWFDFLVTAISFIVLLFHLFASDLGALDSVIVLRTLRLIRFFRIIHIIPNIEKMFRDFKGAFRVAYSILIFGFVILLVIGIFLCTIYKESAPAYFGDPLVSIYSVFRIFTIEGWYEIPDAMTKNTSYINATVIRLLFSFLALLGTFILGFVISSISDELAQDNNNALIEQNKELKMEINKLNKKIDLLISKEHS